jgi:hypothetical protein
MSHRLSKEEVTKAINESTSTIEAGKKLGISKSTVLYWRKLYNISPTRRKNQITIQQEEERMCLYKEGLIDRKIGEKVERTESAIASWRKVRGLPPNKRRKVTKEKFLESYRNGKSDRGIGVVLGIHLTTVGDRRREYGLVPKGHTPTQVSQLEKEQRQRMYDSGMPDARIAKELGRTVCVINSWRHKEGLSLNPARPSKEECLRFYYEHRDMSWREIAIHFGVEWIRTQVGLAMMDECRENPDCPWKSLLPEGKKLAMEKRKKS